MGLEGRLRVVGSTARKLASQEVVEPNDGRIGQDHVAETRQGPAQTPTDPDEVLQRAVHGRLEHRGEAGGEPIVKAALLDALAGRLLIRAPEGGQGALPPHAEAEHHRPEERRRVHLPQPLDRAARTRERDEECRRKACAAPRGSG